MRSTTPTSPRRQEAVRRLYDELTRFSRSLRQRSGDWSTVVPDLSRGDMVTLGVLHDRGSTRPGQIALSLNVDPSVVSRQLAGLAGRDLVVRGTDPLDGRAELISITPAGESSLLAARQAMCDLLAERLEHWQLDDITAAVDTVEDLIALVHPVPAADHPPVPPPEHAPPSPPVHPATRLSTSKDVHV